MNKVIIKTTEQGAYGVGVKLIEGFNKRVKTISYKKWK